eukprot:6198737-Pleurochrysis_carterae.AAC.3
MPKVVAGSGYSECMRGSAVSRQYAYMPKCMPLAAVVTFLITAHVKLCDTGCSAARQSGSNV